MVVANDLHEVDAAAAVGALSGGDGRRMTYATDVADRAQVDAMMAEMATTDDAVGLLREHHRRII